MSSRRICLRPYIRHKPRRVCPHTDRAGRDARVWLNDFAGGRFTRVKWCRVCKQAVKG